MSCFTMMLWLTTLQKLVRELDQLPGLRIKLIDFEQYNEEKLSKLTEEKLKNFKKQDFEKAANLREQEKECLKYTKFQKYFKFKHSFFTLKMESCFTFIWVLKRMTKKLSPSYSDIE